LDKPDEWFSVVSQPGSQEADKSGKSISNSYPDCNILALFSSLQLLTIVGITFSMITPALQSTEICNTK
jgi:hypothetical protein